MKIAETACVCDELCRLLKKKKKKKKYGVPFVSKFTSAGRLFFIGDI